MLDAGPHPVPMHVVSPFADVKDRAVKDKAIKSSERRPWIWETDKPLPDLPPRGNLGRNTAADEAAPDSHGSTAIESDGPAAVE